MTRSRALLIAAPAILAALLPTVAAADVTELVPGTAVLLDQSSGSGSGGNGTSTSSSTNIFSPAAYVDYKRFGGEPTVVVDRYPFTTAAACSPNAAPCFKDIAYASAPNGFVYPHYSPFWKSSDLGETWRVPAHLPSFGSTLANAGGGGDSHIAVGQKSHRVFFVDLPGPGCVTSNTSDDLGETWTSDPIGCGLNEGAIDDRQWVAVDETAGAPGALAGTNGVVGNAYITFINFTNAIAPTLAMVRSRHDGDPGTFASDSNCTFLSTVLIPGSTPILPSGSVDPDQADFRLQVAGPPVVDTSSKSPNRHSIYIPFVRGGPGLTSQVQASPPWDLWVAISRDAGNSWTQKQGAVLG